MAIKDLLPWNRPSAKQEIIPLRNQTKEESIQQESIWTPWMRDIWRDPFGWPFSNDLAMLGQGFSPSFDLSESDKEILVRADLPGMEAKDIKIALEANHLMISGEKKMEKEEKGHTYTRIGRMYGSFQQRIPLTANLVDENQIKATYKNGVLQIQLPKKEPALNKSRKIPIKTQ